MESYLSNLDWDLSTGKPPHIEFVGFLDYSHNLVPDANGKFTLILFFDFLGGRDSVEFVCDIKHIPNNKELIKTLTYVFQLPIDDSKFSNPNDRNRLYNKLKLEKSVKLKYYHLLADKVFFNKIIPTKTIGKYEILTQLTQ